VNSLPGIPGLATFKLYLLRDAFDTARHKHTLKHGVFTASVHAQSAEKPASRIGAAFVSFQSGL
jgi:hypothetical protein